MYPPNWVPFTDPWFNMSYFRTDSCVSCQRDHTPSISNVVSIILSTPAPVFFQAWLSRSTAFLPWYFRQCRGLHSTAICWPSCLIQAGPPLLLRCRKLHARTLFPTVQAVGTWHFNMRKLALPSVAIRLGVTYQKVLLSTAATFHGSSTTERNETRLSWFIPGEGGVKSI